MRSASSNADKGKQTWTSRLSSKIKIPKGAKQVDPIEQELALASSLEVQGKTAEAIYTYSSILAKEDRADAHHRLAVLHDKQGDFLASEEHYQKALKSDPKNAELLCDRGYSCLLQGRMEDAQGHLNKAIKYAPQLDRAHNNLGLLLAQQGHIDRALVEFATAGCSHAEARTNLAYALTVVGKVAEAEYHLAIANQADAHLKPVGELKHTLRQMTLGNTPESNSPQLVATSKPAESFSRKLKELSQTTSQQSIEPINQQVVAMQPISEQYEIASSEQLNDHPSSAMNDIAPTPVNVEFDNMQQSGQPKYKEIEYVTDQLTEFSRSTETLQPSDFLHSNSTEQLPISSSQPQLTAKQSSELNLPVQLQTVGESNGQREEIHSEIVILP